MKKEELFEAIGNVSDQKISEAVKKRNEKMWLRITAAAAALALIIGAAAVLPRMRAGNGWTGGDGGIGGDGGPATSATGSGDGEPKGYTYMSYAGPVFPMTTMDGAHGVTAERSTDLDFSPYITKTVSYEDDGVIRSYEESRPAIIVTDSYVLENPSGEDVTLDLLYPAAASLLEQAELLPEITVDGQAVTASLYTGAYTGGYQDGELNLSGISGFEEYKKIIESGYMQSAFAEKKREDIPAVVYMLDDFEIAPTDAENPTLSLECYIDYSKTTVLTYNSNGGTNDTENGFLSRCIFLGRMDIDPKPMYFIVIGEDIDGCTLQGYRDGGCEKGDEIDITASVTRYETTLGELVGQFADNDLSVNFPRYYDDTEKKIYDLVERDTVYSSVFDTMERAGVLSGSPYGRYDFGMLEDIFGDTYSMGRIFYSRFTVTVPAGESVSVEAKMIKNNSTNYVGDYEKIDGFELATRLGSDLGFTAQYASVSNTGAVDIIENNFGFDLEKGVARVALDMNKECYYIRVAGKDLH